MKKSLFLVIAVFSIVSVAALELSDLKAVFDVVRVKDDTGDYVVENTVQLSSEQTRDTSQFSYYYSVNAEKNTADIEEIDFYLMNGRYYARILRQNSYDIYRVIENNDFFVALQNINDDRDVIRLVYNKVYNDFDYQEYYNSISDLYDDDMYYELHGILNNHKSVGYDTAKVKMFGEIDNDEYGDIHCVYTDLVVHSTYPNNNVMNCEHTWPQSKFGGGSTYLKKSDLFHLFPTDMRSNSARGNWPFGWVKEIDWQKDDSIRGPSASGRRVFEPKDEHKGNVARAMFYMCVRYRMSLDEEQEEALREWHELDPVDEAEIIRNNMIEDLQHTRNPFIDRPDFVDHISDF